MDIDRDFARLRTQSVALSLSTADLCCLLVLRVRESESAALAERDVLDLLSSVHEQFAEAENPRKRATHGLQRLREQRMVTMVSLGGLAREGEYSLSGLGRAIVEFFVDDAKLTRESLKVLTATLGSQLTRVRDDARTATTSQDWEDCVVVPITVASRSLLEGIERRTRGLDAEQETVRADIARLLSEQWLEAMEQTRDLLETMTARLEELRDLILQEQKGLEAILDDIQGLAQAAVARSAEQAIGELLSRLAGLSEWGTTRHHAWSTYYQSMLLTLRSLVRLDPDRALTQRLRDSLHEWPDHPWTMVVAPRLRIHVLRPVDYVADRPPVERQHRAEGVPEHVAAPEAVQLEALVKRAIDGGAPTLTAVLREVLPAVVAEARFRDAGRVTELVARTAVVHSPLERSWVHVEDGLLAEDWQVERRG